MCLLLLICLLRLWFFQVFFPIPISKPNRIWVFALSLLSACLKFREEREKKKNQKVVSPRSRMKKSCLDAKIESSTWKRQFLRATPSPPCTLLTPRISRTPTPPLVTMLTARFLTTTTRTWPCISLLCLLLLLLILLHRSLSLHPPPPPQSEPHPLSPLSNLFTPFPRFQISFSPMCVFWFETQ